MCHLFSAYKPANYFQDYIWCWNWEFWGETVEISECWYIGFFQLWLEWGELERLLQTAGKLLTYFQHSPQVSVYWETLYLTFLGATTLGVYYAKQDPCLWEWSNRAGRGTFVFYITNLVPFPYQFPKVFLSTDCIIKLII